MMGAEPQMDGGSVAADGMHGLHGPGAAVALDGNQRDGGVEAACGGAELEQLREWRSDTVEEEQHLQADDQPAFAAAGMQEDDGRHAAAGLEQQHPAATAAGDGNNNNNTSSAAAAAAAAAAAGAAGPADAQHMAAAAGAVLGPALTGIFDDPTAAGALAAQLGLCDNVQQAAVNAAKFLR